MISKFTGPSAKTLTLANKHVDERERIAVRRAEIIRALKNA